MSGSVAGWLSGPPDTPPLRYGSQRPLVKMMRLLFLIFDLSETQKDTPWTQNLGAFFGWSFVGWSFWMYSLAGPKTEANRNQGANIHKVKLKNTKNTHTKFCWKKSKKQPWLEPCDLRSNIPSLLAILGELIWTPFSGGKHISHVVSGGCINNLSTCFNVPGAAPCRLPSATTSLICAIPVFIANAMTGHKAWQKKRRDCQRNFVERLRSMTFDLFICWFLDPHLQSCATCFPASTPLHIDVVSNCWTPKNGSTNTKNIIMLLKMDQHFHIELWNHSHIKPLTLTRWKKHPHPTWRVTPLRKWLITLVSKSPRVSLVINFGSNPP